MFAKNPPLSLQQLFINSVASVGCYHGAMLWQPLAGWFVLGYLAFLWQLRRAETARAGFYFGWLVGLGIMVPQTWFVFGIFSWVAVALWLLMSIWLGLVVAVWQAGSRRWGNQVMIWLAPLTMLGVEYFRSEVWPLKFTWDTAGFALPAAGIGRLGLLGNRARNGQQRVVGFALFFLTALFGRLWCGWACPQTVFLDHIFRRIERLIAFFKPRHSSHHASAQCTDQRMGGFQFHFLILGQFRRIRLRLIVRQQFHEAGTTGSQLLLSPRIQQTVRGKELAVHLDAIPRQHPVTAPLRGKTDALQIATLHIRQQLLRGAQRIKTGVQKTWPAYAQSPAHREHVLYRIRRGLDEK